VGFFNYNIKKKLFILKKKLKKKIKKKKKKKRGKGRGFIKQGHNACLKVANQKAKYLL
jgi:hypothetical protein